MAKQVPKDERTPTRDVSSSSPAQLIQSPSVPTGKSISEWDRWVEQQKKLAAVTGHAEVVREGDVPMYAAKRRPKSARPVPKSARSAREQTASRLQAMSDAKAKNDAEVEELKMLLGRTLYTGGGNNFQRAGNVATAGLRKLNDGQADDIATLRRRRIAEEQAALEANPNRPAWDATPMHYCPPALKGCQPITTEPWARDQLAYETGMQGHGATNITAMSYELTGSRKKHVSLIANDMDKYRKEVGGGKMGTPSSARVNRAWNEATPRTNSGRYSTRKHTNRMSARPSGRSSSPDGTVEEPPVRIVLTERQAQLRQKLLEAQATGA